MNFCLRRTRLGTRPRTWPGAMRRWTLRSRRRPRQTLRRKLGARQLRMQGVRQEPSSTAVNAFRRPPATRKPAAITEPVRIRAGRLCARATPGGHPRIAASARRAGMTTAKGGAHRTHAHQTPACRLTRRARSAAAPMSACARPEPMTKGARAFRTRPAARRPAADTERARTAEAR